MKRQTEMNRQRELEEAERKRKQKEWADSEALVRKLNEENEREAEQLRLLKQEEVRLKQLEDQRIKDADYAKQFETIFDESEKNRIKLNEEQNSCFICTEPTFNGDYYVILESCKCVTHRECISGYIDAELEKGNFEIKCLNSAVPTSSDKCKQPLPFDDLLQCMSQAQFDRMN